MKGFDFIARYYRRNRKYGRNKQSIFEILLPLVFFLSLFLSGGNLKVVIISSVAFGIVLPVLCHIISGYLTRKKYLESGMSDIDSMSGEDFEQVLKVHFEKIGYKASTTPKSNDYGADLIMEKNGSRIVVQAKRYNQKVGIGAIQEIIGAKAYYNANQAIVATNNFFTSNAINLAKSSGVELFDRNKLLQLISKEDITTSKSSSDVGDTAHRQFATEPSALMCPRCGRKLVVRNGKNGRFYGCSGFPNCRYTKNM